MAIVKMSEFDLFVRNDDLDSLLVALQRYRNVMFREAMPEIEGFYEVESEYDFEDNSDKQNHIQSILKRLAEIKKSEGNKGQIFENLSLKTMNYNELDQIVGDTDLDNILDMYAEYYESNRHMVENYEIYIPWEEESFSNESLQKLEGVKPIIGTVPKEMVEELVENLKELKDIYFMYQRPNEKHDSIFVVLPIPMYHDKVSVLVEKCEMESRSSISLQIEKELSTMRMFLTQALDKRLNINDRLSRLGLYQEILQAHFEALRNEALRESMRSKFLTSRHVTYIKGWVYTASEAEFKNVIAESTAGIFDLSMNPAPSDSLEIPIKLKNNKFVQAFEPITKMYSQPRYNELDPTPIFAPFYAFFFGMMLADVGYGLIMSLVMYLAQRFLNFKEGTKNMIRLLMYVGAFTVFWGLIYGSFFGGMIPLTPVVDINQDFNTVLVMSLGFGIFHLFYGLAVKGYIHIKNNNLRYVLFDVIFWYMAVGGSIGLVSLMFIDLVKPYTTPLLIVMVIGMIGIVLTNGRDAKTAPGKLASGLYGLYGMTDYVGDIVSYSRLMALGLSGASIGMAFNMMVDMVSGMGVIGVIFGVGIFIFGHTFNLLISGLSAYVHSARLTYVEFFGKFFTGGGRAFNEFIAQPTYIELEED